MKKLVVAASVATLALAGAAFAETHKPGGGGGEQTLARADALARSAQMFDRMDANKDSKLDAADREARRTAAFDRLDANKDGNISRAEFAAPRPVMGAGAERRGNGMGHGMGHGMGQRRGGGMMLMRMADSDRDGAVSRAEFATAAAARFDRVDANRDGQITPAERQAARAAMRQRMQDRMQLRGQGGEAQLPVN